MQAIFPMNDMAMALIARMRTIREKVEKGIPFA